jgi:hypothetical protein
MKHMFSFGYEDELLCGDKITNTRHHYMRSLLHYDNIDILQKLKTIH